MAAIIIVSFLPLAISSRCAVMVMVGVAVTVFAEALDIIGDGDWEMAEHTVLAPSMEGYSSDPSHCHTIPTPSPKFHLNLESSSPWRDTMQGFRFMDGSYFPD